MKIQVLGMGCRKCERLHENVLAALRESDLSAEIEKVTDLARISAMGVFMTPALAIDGEVVFTGRVADVEELVHLLEGHAS
jgi:small redox-active disulfide protein 2